MTRRQVIPPLPLPGQPEPEPEPEPKPSYPPLPADSGSGRRIVYAVSQQRVWIVDAEHLWRWAPDGTTVRVTASSSAAEDSASFPAR